MPLSLSSLDRLSLPRRLATDREPVRQVAFAPAPEFFALAKRYGLSPRRLAYLLSQTLVAASPEQLTISGERGVAPECLWEVTDKGRHMLAAAQRTA